MPPLTLMVLEALANDIETVKTMRSHGEANPYGLALVEEDRVLGAIRDLLADDQVEALQAEWPDYRYSLVPDAAQLDSARLRRYWYRPTDRGWEALREGEELLDAYWDAHPITFPLAVQLKGLWRAFRWRLPF